MVEERAHFFLYHERKRLAKKIRFVCAHDYDIHILAGDLPYPMYTNDEAVEQLRRGYRMPCPKNCSPEM